MIKNVGTTDRIVRLIVGAVLTSLFFTKVISGVLGIILLVLAGIFALTAAIGFCPLYLPFGINSCPSKIKKTT
jgi:hypothetical protein